MADDRIPARHGEEKRKKILLLIRGDRVFSNVAPCGGGEGKGKRRRAFFYNSGGKEGTRAITYQSPKEEERGGPRFGIGEKKGEKKKGRRNLSFSRDVHIATLEAEISENQR